MKYLVLIISGLIVLTGATAVFVFFLMAPEAPKVYKIGILQFADAPVPKTIIENVLKNLKKQGFSEDNLLILYPESPASDSAKAGALVDYFLQEKVDVILATNSIGAKIVFEKVKETPVVFTAVAKPLPLGIAESYISSGNNFTGVEFAVPLSKTLELIKSGFPAFKKIGVLYSQTEPSPVLYEELKTAGPDFGFQVISRQTTANDFEAAVNYFAAQNADFIYLLPDPTLVPYIKQLKQSADRHGLPIVGNTIDGEYLMSLVADTKEMGFLAADLIIKILNGNKPSSLSIQMPQKFNLTLNQADADLKKIIFPEWLSHIADRIITKEGVKETVR
ncbi:MAG: ABC transporter substrate-binding protein [Patescibacteria group bacterium]